uniref:Uncharacterized protein n=1 Tax=Ananas comosus var. bracteatus TaxID=296719 RepID=A0A6V7PV01_ANACO|nr:unnamed protein product [Ananas comosus var. bracteatus]
MMDLGCSRVAICRAVYRYNIDVVPEQMVYRYNIGSVSVHMGICELEARVCCRAGLIPVHFPVYRYTLLCGLMLWGAVFAIIANPINVTPAPLESLLNSNQWRNKKLWLRVWSLREDQSSNLENYKLGLEHLERHDDLEIITDFYACLPLCSFAHACEGRSLQAGIPELAIATYARPCGIGRRSGLPSGSFNPSMGMLTTTGPLGTAQARQPAGGSYKIGTMSS